MATIIDYTNILHAHGVASPEAEAFKEKLADDPVFQKRATTLEQLMGLKNGSEEQRRQTGAEPTTLDETRQGSDEREGSCGCEGGDCS